MIPGMVSIILPTANRVERAVACLTTLYSTLPVDTKCEVICCIDNDLASVKALPEVPSRSKKHRIAILYQEPLEGAAKAWNRGLRASQGEYIVMAADDLTFSPGWLEAALAALSTLPEGIGLVGLHDGHQEVKPDAWCTHWLAHRQFLLTYMGGVMAFEAYRYGYNDTEAWFRASLAGRYIYCPEALVYHSHYDYGERPKDDLDTLNRSYLAEATEVMHKRMAAGWPDDFEPAITE